MRYIRNISAFQAWLLLSVMAASCTTKVLDEEGGMSDKPISFGVPTAEDTRAAITGTEFPKESFKAWGGKVTGNETPTNPKDAYNNIFDGTEIKYSDARGWYYEGELKFWEENTTYNFYGVYPATVETYITNGTDTDGKTVVHIEAPNFEASKLGDEAVDFMTAGYTESLAVPVAQRQAIKLNFQHRLTRVNFVMESTAMAALDIIGVGLKGVAYKGHFVSESAGGNWQYTAKSTTSLMSSGTETDIPENFTIKEDKIPSVSSEQYTDLFGDMLLLPYNYAGETDGISNNAQLVIQYQEKDGSIAGKELTINEEWRMGRSYRYIIGLSASSNELVIKTFEICDWSGKVEAEITW